MTIVKTETEESLPRGRLMKLVYYWGAAPANGGQPAPGTPSLAGWPAIFYPRIDSWKLSARETRS
jgi:hypothetical protein